MIDINGELLAAADRLLDACVGENLDQLCTLDLRGDGVSRALYQAARDIQRGPLTLAAASALVKRARSGSDVLMLTGFLSPKPYPETDGLVGSAVLAHAIQRACGARPVFACESEVIAPLSAGLRGAGLSVTGDPSHRPDVPHAVVLPFPNGRDAAEAEAERLARLVDASACVAVERPGANSRGQYHLAMGANVSADIAPIDLLYQALAARGVLTIAVGDFGNELGMGALYDVIRAETPAGADCGCGCGGGIACPTHADITVSASVSDWGAYAIAAYLSHLKRDPAVLVGAGAYRRMVDATVAAGAIDGPTRYAVPWVDGVDDGFNAALLEVMRAAVRYPTLKSGHSPIRLFRAGRSLEGN
ncbi:MAG TPA: glutamate cyclase domain-containing protein [Chloroflexota bacterium]|nr:glutamate cyclase domain-containing protein [Chloroflexota bacterium]